MKFSKRTNWNTALNLLTQKADELRSHPDFINLTISNPTECGFSYLVPELLAPLTNPGGLKYSPDPRGLLTARKAVARYYAAKGILLHPDQIFITASTSEAYSFVFKILAERGERVLGPAPGYPLMDYLAEINDVVLERYPLIYKSGWQIDREALQHLKAAKAILAVHPSNPAGHYVSESEQAFLSNWASRHQAALISDEVFFDFSLDDTPPAPSFAAQNEALTFTLSGISKILGLPQMKLSWIVVTGPEDLRIDALKRLEIVADTYLSASTPIQMALPLWMENMPMIHREILKRIRSNRSFLEQFFSGSKIDVLKSSGGWTSILRMPAERTDEEWALQLLDQDKILFHPGYLFDINDDMTALVVSLITPEAQFQQGLNRMRIF